MAFARATFIQLGLLVSLLVGGLMGAVTSPEAGPPHSKVQIGGIQWYTSYDDGIATARHLKKPLLVHLGENPG